MPTKPTKLTLKDLADRLGKNKSTLSRTAKRLEAATGKPIGTRTARGIELTDAEVKQLAAAVALARPGNPTFREQG